MKLNKPLSRKIQNRPRPKQLPANTTELVLGDWKFTVNDDGDLVVKHRSGKEITLAQHREEEE